MDDALAEAMVNLIYRLYQMLFTHHLVIKQADLFAIVISQVITMQPNLDNSIWRFTK